MKKIIIGTLIIGLTTLMAGSYKSGNNYYHDNGSYSKTIGKTTYHSNNTYSRKIGSSTYNSDGSSARKSGNKVYRSDSYYGY